MTYEKFERKLIEMFLEGVHAQEEKLWMQVSELETDSRVDSEQGFTVNFTVPNILKIDGLNQHIFGMRITRKDEVIASIELVIEDGLITRLKGVFTRQMTYEKLVGDAEFSTFEFVAEDAPQVVEKNEEDVVTHVKSTDESVEVTQTAVVPEEEVIEPMDEAVVLVEEPFELVEEVADVSVDEGVLMPPSFSIPKIPEAIVKRWSEEDVALNVGTLSVEPEIDVLATPPADSMESVELAEIKRAFGKKDGNIDPIMGGKAPQGPVTFTEAVEVKEASDAPEEFVSDDAQIPLQEDGFSEEAQELTNTLAETLVDEPEQREEVVDAPLGEEKVASFLDSIEYEDADATIEMMQRRNKEHKLTTAIIVLIAVVVLYLLFITFVIN